MDTMDTDNPLLGMLMKTNLSQVVDEARLPPVLSSVMHGGSTPRSGYGCNDAFSVFAFLAFLLALLQLMQDMGEGRSGRSKREVCPDYEGDTRLREGTLAAYTMFTGTEPG